MTSEETIKMLTAKVECMKRESSGIDQDCNYRNCDECKLCYEQGTVGEQIEALQMAITAIKGQKVLADVLDGCPLPQPCDKMWRSDVCEEYCQNNKLEAPDAECWLRYAEVMANES